MHLKPDEILERIKAKREAWAMEHYGKHEVELSLDQMKELDTEYPGWTLVFTRKSYPIEVTLGGTRVRDYKTQKEIRISYPFNGSGKPVYPFIVVGLANNRHIQVLHRILARIFVFNPDPDNKTEVNHIDGNKWNNDYLNLEWVTHAENMQHAYRTGLEVAKRGEDVWLSKYTKDQVREVCELLQSRSDITFKEIEEITGVNAISVGEIYRRENWKSVSEDFTFLKRDKLIKGERNGNNMYTEGQIKLVCQLLQDRPDLTFEEVSELTGVKYRMIVHIISGDNWSYISKDYTFPPRDSYAKGEDSPNSKYTTEQAEAVCKLLDDVYIGKTKLSKRQIARMCGVSNDMVNDISLGRTWRHVSAHHQFYQAKLGKSAEVY